MKKPLLAILVLLNVAALAQDETVKRLKAEADKKIKKEEDTTQRAWKTGGLYNLNVAQGSLSNWAAGGDNFSLSLNSIFNVYAFYTKNKISWDNTLDLNLGYLRSTSLGSRKNDDRIDLLSKYGYAVTSDWNVSTLLNFRSQMLKGYTFPDEVKTFSSAFLSPAYVLTSVGMDYKPNQEFSVFLSPITARWVIVKDDSLSAKGSYGVDTGRHTRSELGAFVSANYIKEFNKILSYRGRIDLFSNYKHNPQNVDLFLTNILSIKLSRYLSATWNVDLIYDDDVRIFGKEGTSPSLQLKSLVGLGLMMKF